MNKEYITNIFHKIIFTVLLSSFGLQYSKAQNCTVNAGISETICNAETMQLQGNSTGLISTAAIWSQVGGLTVNVINPNNLTSDVTGYTSGQIYTFRITATCQDGVSVYDEVTINVAPVTVANAGTDQQTCPGDAILSLGANSPGIGETGLWSIQSNDGNISGLTTSNFNSTIDLPQNVSGSSTLSWSINNPNGCSTSDEVIITNFGGVLPISAGPDQLLGNCYTGTQTTSLAGSFAGDGTGGQRGTWSLVSGPNYPTITDVNDENTQVSNLFEGVYIFRWQVEGPCVSGDDEVSITVPAPTQAVTVATADNLRFCHGTTTAVLEGSIPQYTGEIGTWTQLFGPPAIIANSTHSTTTVTGLDGTSSYRFSYTITNATTGCSNTNNDIYIRFTEAPTIDVGPDQILECGENSVSITPSVTGGTSTRYKIISGPFTQAAWTGFNSESITINQLNQEGTYAIQFERYSVGSGCTSAFDMVNVSVALSPTQSNAGTDQNLACNVIETDLAGNLPLAGTGTWSQVSGPNIANIDDIYDRSSHIDNLIEGQYVFRWVISGGNYCPTQEDEVIVNVATSIPAAAAGNDKTVCHSTEVILEGNTPKPGSMGEWSVTPNIGITFSNINDPSASVFGMVANTAYTFTWTITNQCQVESANVVITTGNVAGPSPAIAGPDQCEATGTIILSMDGNEPMVGQGLWTIISGPNTPTIADNTLPTTTVTGLIDGHYEIEWSINVPGCISTRDTLLASIVSAVTQSNAGEDESVCGSSVTMSANAPLPNETGYWEQVSGNSGYTVSDIYDYNATFSDLLPGRYEFAWIIEKGICPSSSDTMVLTVSEQPATSVTALDYTVCGGTTATLAANNPNSGTGIWTVIGAATTQPIIASINSPTTTVTNLSSGEYDFRWTITSGPDCAEEIDEITIQVSAPAIAEPNQALCNATEAFLEGTVGTDGTWTISPVNTGFPLPIINNTNAHTAVITDMAFDQTYTFRYTVPPLYGCPSSSDDLTVSTSPFGTAPDAGPDQEICLNLGNSVAMAANSPVVGTGNWNQLSGPNTANITDAGLNTTTIDDLISGTYIFEWNIDNGNCGNYSDVTRIVVNEPPTSADAGQDQINACALNAQLAANLPSSGIGTWTLISAPSLSASTALVINNPNLPNTTISNITELGDYEFMWSITSGSTCTASTDNVIISFNAVPPTTPNAGTDQDFCNTTSIVMDGNLPIEGNGTWSQLSGPNTVTITNPGSYNTSVTGLTSGIYEFQWEIVNGGCVLADNITIVNSALPPNADASGTDPDICQFEPIQLVGNDPSPGTGTWSFISGPTTPVISAPDNRLSNITNTSSGTYTFRWTVANGSCTSTSDDVEIRIGNSPQIDLIVDGNTVCQNADGTVVIQSSQPGVSYNLYNNLTLAATGTGTGSDLSVLVNGNNLNTGNNTINIVANNAGCMLGLTNQAIINVNANPLSNLEIEDIEICNNDAAVITINNSENNINYQLFIENELVGEGEGNGSELGIPVSSDFYEIGTNTVSVKATNLINTCSVDMIAEPEIVVNWCSITVYDGFSPNNDGINETFIIVGLDRYPEHKVLIFNRWGNKVYEASPYLNDWDGTNMFGVTVGGKKLPVGTYFYIIELGNGERAVKGYVYLNR